MELDVRENLDVCVLLTFFRGQIISERYRNSKYNVSTFNLLLAIATACMHRHLLECNATNEAVVSNHPSQSK